MASLKTFGVASAILVIGSAAIAGESWRPMNTGMPGAVSGIIALTTDPRIPSILYAITNTGALFRSADGDSWGLVNSVAGVRSLAIDPTNSSNIYAVLASGVVKSTDRGESWADAGTGLEDRYVSSLSIDPMTPSTVYALTAGGLYKSLNGGGNWKPIAPGDVIAVGLSPNLILGPLAIDPKTSTLYGSSPNRGLVKSTDGGENWMTIKPAFDTGYFVTALAIDPVNTSTIYAGFLPQELTEPGQSATGGIFKSTDSGESWTAYRAGMPKTYFVSSLSIDPVTPSTIYAGAISNNGNAILTSTDGGQNWKLANLALPAGSNPVVTISRGTVSTLYAGYSGPGGGAGNLMKSADGGGTWSNANAGLTYIDIRALAVDPLHPSVLYAGGSAGVFQSQDSGANWTRRSMLEIAAVPFPPPASITNPFGDSPGIVRYLLIDSSNPDILYAGAARANGCAATDRVIFKSTDAGASWTDKISPPFSGCMIGFLSAASPPVMTVDPVDTNTIYLGESDDEDGIHSLLKSSDGGESWTAIWDYGNGLQSGLKALAVDPKDRGVLYAGLEDVYPSPAADTASRGGVARSVDGGMTWKSAGLENNAVSMLAIDPSNSSVLYAATQGDYSTPRGFRGLFKSLDHGATWSRADAGLSGVSRAGAVITGLLVAPGAVYAGTSGDGVYRSVDGGESWAKLNEGLQSLDIRALAASSNTVYAATPAGVFTLSSAF